MEKQLNQVTGVPSLSLVALVISLGWTAEFSVTAYSLQTDVWIKPAVINGRQEDMIQI